MKKFELSDAYEKDNQCGNAVLTLLRSQGDKLPSDIQSDLVSLATKPHRLGHPKTSIAINAVLNLYPALAQHVTPQSMQLYFLRPVYLWVGERNGTSCHLKARFLDWRNELRIGDHRGLENCLHALNISYALREEFSDSDLSSLASFWQDENDVVIWNQTEYLNAEHRDIWCAIVAQLGQLGQLYEHLAANGIKENTSPGKPPWSFRWRKCLKSALRRMTTEEQEACIKYWANNSMSKVYILRACTQANIETWLRPDVCTVLATLLPQSETERWKMLPWKSTSERSSLQNAGKQNQAMMRLYCPDACDILDVVTTLEMWAEQKAIAACMAQFTKNAQPVDQMEHASSLFEVS